MFACKSCKSDVSDLVNWDTLCNVYIACPKCGYKMEVNYDESWDGETENGWWWLTSHVDQDCYDT